MIEIIELASSMAPYLLLGFLLAGLMHAFIPKVLYSKYLGGNSFRAVFNAALLGIPLPLCSCGVLPTAMSLRKEGASKAATVSFLISTPQTGVDSIIATYSLMGLAFALLRPLIAFVTSLIGGLMVGWFAADNNSVIAQSTIPLEQKKTTFLHRVSDALHYAYIEMMQDIGKWLVVGLIVAGLITVFVPDSFFAIFADKSFLSMLLVLVFSIPMYLCATGSIPIAVALMLKGLSPGTALVLLIAGPAVNVASTLVISKVMGKRTLFIYLASIIVCSIFFGLGLDCFLPREWFTEHLSYIYNCHEQGLSYFNIGCFVLLLVLLCNAFIHKWRKSQSCHCQCNEDACGGALSQEEKREFVVSGMRCNHCAANVKNALLKVDGVKSVDVTLSDGHVIVYGRVKKLDILKSVEDLGFDIVSRDGE
jgi:uncharacterized membrane protein YraQ (UPF0718 family)/copper chaperone CopZ